MVVLLAWRIKTILLRIRSNEFIKYFEDGSLLVFRKFFQFPETTDDVKRRRVH